MWLKKKTFAALVGLYNSAKKCDFFFLCQFFLMSNSIIINENDKQTLRDVTNII